MNGVLNLLGEEVDGNCITVEKDQDDIWDAISYVVRYFFPGLECHLGLIKRNKKI
jgi:hypothetical protein